RAPRPAVAVLAGDRAVELHHEIGDLVGDLPHLLEAPRRLETDGRSDVQASDRAVAVVRTVHLVPGEDLAEARDELREMPPVDGGVLDEGQRLGIAVRAEEQAEPRLAQLPDLSLLARIERDVGRVAEPLTLAARLQRLHLRAHLSLGVAGVLDDE